MIDERVLPHNLQSEKAVLGTFFLNERAVHDVRSLLIKADFYDPRHQRVYGSIMALVDAGAPIDPITVIDYLEKHDILEKCGGASYITGLEQSVISPDNVGHHAKIVVEKASLRKIIEGCHKISEGAYGTDDTDDSIQKIALLEDFIAKRKQVARTVSFSELAVETVREIQDDVDGISRQRGLYSRLVAVDRLLNGYHPGNLIILAARPSVGKSALALNAALNIAGQGVPTLFASLEMSARDNMRRALANKTNIEGDVFAKHQHNSGTLSVCIQYLEANREMPLHILDDANITVGSLRAAIASVSHMIKQPVKFVVIDYLQLMQDPGHESRQTEVSAISRGLHILARDLNIPILALSQLSRDSDKRHTKEVLPRLSDLRESGAIEQDADVVQFIHRGNDAQQQDGSQFLDIITAKNRNGAVGLEKIKFWPKFQRFEDCSGGGYKS